MAQQQVLASESGTGLRGTQPAADVTRWFVVVSWYLFVRVGGARRAALAEPSQLTEPTINGASEMIA